MSKGQVLCVNGHNFDAGRVANCPFCGAPAAKQEKTFMEKSSSETVAYNDRLPAQSNKSAASEFQKEPPTRPAWWTETQKERLGEQAPAPSPDNPVVDPVVGWLLSIKGPNRGSDYRIFMGNNSVGRAPEMRVRISGDDAVSRERHAFIVYDPKSNKYVLRPGDSQGLVYLNQELVTEVREIKAYDVIELGETNLLFIPACGERFRW